VDEGQTKHRRPRDLHPDEQVIRDAKDRGQAWLALNDAIVMACLKLHDGPTARALSDARKKYRRLRRG